MPEDALVTAEDAPKGGKGKDTEPVEQKMLPPDGGWGWVVVFGFGLNYFVSVPLMQSFGLIFKDAFRRYGMSATDSTTILNVSSAFTFGLGLTNGPLLRKFSYRKVAIAGSLFLFVGVISTSFATTFTHFIITYSIITAIGFCFIVASFNLAMNTYFLKRRGRATGLAMTATGLGPVVMPLLISYLLKEYAVQGTVLIMGGLVLHSLVSSLLLQPVKWHMKPAPPPQQGDEEENEGEEKKDGGESVVEVEEGETTALNEDHHPHKVFAPTVRQRTLTMSSVEHDLDSQSIYGYDTPLVNPSHPERIYDRSNPEISGGEFRRRYARSMSREVARNYWKNSVETINLGSSLRIFDERQHYAQLENGTPSSENNNLTTDKVVKKSNVFKRAMIWVARFFYLELLKDPIYVNIMVGMSAAIFGELNFSMLTPFILNDFGFTTDEIAMVMSVMAGLDITFRFIVPFIAERFHLHPRVMYLFSLSLLICSRSFLIYFNTLSAVLVIAIFLGVAKGVRTVYMTLVIPTYVPLEKLPGASGIQMLSNGLLFAVLGPLLGVIRDISGSYVTCIYFINAMTFFTFCTWIVEMMMSRKGFRGHA